MSADPFVVHERLLFTVAYEMLGSAADAEDVVQETWLRWEGVDQAEVRDARAYLVRLREVFDAPYGEIAEAIGKSPAAVRQIAHRARDHVSARRPRMEVGSREQRRAVELFMAALETGEVAPLIEVLAPDVVLRADGGGVVPALLEPIEGADWVARLVERLAGHARGVALEEVTVNGAPAIWVDRGGLINALVCLSVDPAGQIARIFAIRNPHKLTRLDAEARMTR